MSKTQLTPIETLDRGLWRIYCLTEIAYKAAIEEVVDAPTVASLLEVIMEEANRLHSISNRMWIGLPVDGQEVAK